MERINFKIALQAKKIYALRHFVAKDTTHAALKKIALYINPETGTAAAVATDARILGHVFNLQDYSDRFLDITGATLLPAERFKSLPGQFRILLNPDNLPKIKRGETGHYLISADEQTPAGLDTLFTAGQETTILKAKEILEQAGFSVGFPSNSAAMYGSVFFDSIKASDCNDIDIFFTSPALSAPVSLAVERAFQISIQLHTKNSRGPLIIESGKYSTEQYPDCSRILSDIKNRTESPSVFDPEIYYKTADFYKDFTGYKTVTAPDMSIDGINAAAFSWNCTPDFMGVITPLRRFCGNSNADTFAEKYGTLAAAARNIKY